MRAPIQAGGLQRRWDVCAVYRATMSTTTANDLVTPGDIAAALGETVIRVRYVLDSRRFEPVRRAGIVRMYDADVVDRVRTEIESINHRRRAVPVT